MKYLSNLLLSLFTLVVLGCGGGGGGSSPAPVAPPASMTLTSSVATSLVNTPVTLTANVRQADGTPVAGGLAVAFATTGGTLSAVTTTNANGDATASITSSAAGTFTITATAGTLTKTVAVTFNDLNSVHAISVSPSANPANINTNVTLSATLTPVGTSGVIADGTLVTFISSAGTVSAVTSTINGVATATLNGITAPQTVTVKAVSGIITSPETNINFIDPTSPATIIATTTPGDHFVTNPVTLTIKVNSIGGGVVPVGTPVTFAITSGTATLSQTSSTTDANGNATVTLSNAADGNVTVTITAVTANGTATGSDTITFTDPNKPASIALVANRASGVTNNLGPVILTAALTPANTTTGSIPNGTPVTFTITNGNGGVLSSPSATTNGGVASVTLNSSAAGTITVSATAGSTPVVTSNPITVPFINQPTQVSVKVRTTGTLPAGKTIGGIKVTVNANPSSGLSITASPDGFSPDVTATGAGTGSTLVTNANKVNAITLALVNTTGITTGEFATLNYNVQAGNFPTAADFTVTVNGSVIDTLSANLAGIGVEIMSVTIQ